MPSIHRVQRYHPPLRPSFALLWLLLLCVPAHAQGQELVRPGAWEVKSGTEGQPMVGYRLCFRSGGEADIAQLLPRVPGSACPPGGLRREGDNLLWELACPAAQLSASARYVLRTELIEGRVIVNSGTPPAAHHSMISARYVGACTGE